MQDDNFSLADIGAIFLLLILTFFLNAAFTIPRLFSLSLLFGTFISANWEAQLGKNALSATMIYEFAGFIFAILTGALAVSLTRGLFRRASIPLVCIIVAVMLLVYAVATLLLHGKMPAFFFPTYLDLSAALPGWLIGFILGGGDDAFRTYGKATYIGFGTVTPLIVTAIVVMPLYAPFYQTQAVAPMQPSDQVMPTFHPVPEPPEEQQPAYQPPPPDLFRPFQPVTPDRSVTPSQ